MDFVWIYITGESSYYKCGLFNELEYSIRSVQKMYQGVPNCFVIGDDPKLDDLGVTHIPSPRLSGGRQPRHADQIAKFDKLWDSEVGEEFVLMYDDIYLLQPTTKEELQITYARSEITDVYEYAKNRMGTTLYKQLWVSTYDYIKTFRDSKNLKTYDWETHLPRYMVKNNLKSLIDRLNLREVPKISTSLYAAYHSEETLIMPDGLQSDLWTHKPGMDFDKEFDKSYMNIYDNVIVPEFVEHMKQKFD